LLNSPRKSEEDTSSAGEQLVSNKIYQLWISLSKNAEAFLIISMVVYGFENSFIFEE
jgi:hypothetical protein